MISFSRECRKFLSSWWLFPAIVWTLQSVQLLLFVWGTSWRPQTRSFIKNMPKSFCMRTGGTWACKRCSYCSDICHLPHCKSSRDSQTFSSSLDLNVVELVKLSFWSDQTASAGHLILVNVRNWWHLILVSAYCWTRQWFCCCGLCQCFWPSVLFQFVSGLIKCLSFFC